MGHKDIMVFSGVVDNLCKKVNHGVIIVLKGNCHSLNYLLQAAGLPLQEANMIYTITMDRYH